MLLWVTQIFLNFARVRQTKERLETFHLQRMSRISANELSQFRQGLKQLTNAKEAAEAVKLENWL